MACRFTKRACRCHWGSPSEPTHTLVPCRMPKPLPPRNQCTGCFAPAGLARDWVWKPICIAGWLCGPMYNLHQRCGSVAIDDIALALAVAG